MTSQRQRTHLNLSYLLEREYARSNQGLDINTPEELPRTDVYARINKQALPQMSIQKSRRLVYLVYNELRC